MQIPRTAVTTDETFSDTGLVCPVCGDNRVSFHSRTTVAIRRTVDWVGIFLCSDSHLFFVPLTGLLVPLDDANNSNLSVKELRRSVHKRIASLKETLQVTRQSLHANRSIRKQISATIKENRKRRGEKPCRVVVQLCGHASHR